MNHQEIIDHLHQEMQQFDGGKPSRIQHLTKVHSFAAQIGRKEGLDPETQFTLEITAVLHDIGIKPSKEKYGYCDGKTQEELGPPIAEAMLRPLHVPDHIIQRVCYLIANHHTYDNVVGLDYRILLEADFLVNLYENDLPKDSVISALENIFKTETGRTLCKNMFAIA